MTWFPFPSVPVVAQAYLYKVLAIAVVLSIAIAGSSGFWAGKEWAEGRAAQQEVKTLAAEIEQGHKALGEYRTAVADGATHLVSASRALEISATHYAEERDDALARFDAATTTLQAKLDRRADLAGCLFGPDILRDINAARSGSPTGSPAGAAQPAAGPRRRPAAAVPPDAAPTRRRGANDGSRAGG